jgi:hypothetical protein
LLFYPLPNLPPRGTEPGILSPVGEIRKGVLKIKNHGWFIRIIVEVCIFIIGVQNNNKSD